MLGFRVVREQGSIFLTRFLDLGFASVIEEKVESEWFTVLIAAFSTE
jgi:hypothetical protein